MSTAIVLCLLFTLFWLSSTEFGHYLEKKYFLRSAYKLQEIYGSKIDQPISFNVVGFLLTGRYSPYKCRIAFDEMNIYILLDNRVRSPLIDRFQVKIPRKELIFVEHVHFSLLFRIFSFSFVKEFNKYAVMNHSVYLFIHKDCDCPSIIALPQENEVSNGQTKQN
jgi:hypothetical protein